MLACIKKGNKVYLKDEPITHYWKYIHEPWTQPILTENGTMGGNSFACSSDTILSPRDAWYAFDGTLGTDNDTFLLKSNSGSLYFYNPEPLKISKLTVTNRDEKNVRAIRRGIFYGSNDFIMWNELCQFTNSDFTRNGVWEITVNSMVAYKYYKFLMKQGDGTYVGLNELDITAVKELIEETTSSDYDFTTIEHEFSAFMKG